MPRTHILPEPRGRERASASEAATAAEAARAAAAGAAEASGARAAAAAAERSRRCRQWRPHRPRRGFRLRVAAPLARAPGQSAASPELAAETEGTSGDPEHPKSLVSPPHLPLQAPRDGCRVGVGVAGGEGWTVFPRPHLLAIAPFSRLRTSRRQGRLGERGGVVFRGGERLRRAQQVPRGPSGRRCGNYEVGAGGGLRAQARAPQGRCAPGAGGSPRQGPAHAAGAAVRRPRGGWLARAGSAPL